MSIDIKTGMTWLVFAYFPLLFIEKTISILNTMRIDREYDTAVMATPWWRRRVHTAISAAAIITTLVGGIGLTGTEISKNEDHQKFMHDREQAESESNLLDPKVQKLESPKARSRGVLNRSKTHPAQLRPVEGRPPRQLRSSWAAKADHGRLLVQLRSLRGGLLGR